MRNTTKADVYSQITDRIVEALENGTAPWQQPWETPISLPLRHNGQAYQGINIVILWLETFEKGYSSPYWMTYKQAQELGGQVRKGERAQHIVYATTVTKTESDDTGEEIDKTFGFLKSYAVFNANQIDGLPEHYYPIATPVDQSVPGLEQAETFFNQVGATVEHGGAKAFYSIDRDKIRMPNVADFKDLASYYAVRAHETIHWTRHSSRLDRSFGRKRFGDEGYAMEELVAEIGSAFLCADLGITSEVREDHSAYIAAWLQVLKNDKRAIFTAASHAQRAFSFLHDLQHAEVQQAA